MFMSSKMAAYSALRVDRTCLFHCSVCGSARRVSSATL